VGAVLLTVPETGWFKIQHRRQGTGTGKLDAIGTLVAIWTERYATWLVRLLSTPSRCPRMASLAAAMQYSIQGLDCDDPGRKDLLMDIGTEESP
jgi:hypothetical protein